MLVSLFLLLDADYDLLRWDPLEVQQPAPVAAHRGSEGPGPGVLEADQHGRLAGLERLSREGGVLIAEHARPRPFKHENVTGPVAVEVCDLNARDRALGVLLDHQDVQNADD